MKTGKRVLTWLLAVCLMLQLLPVTAFAGSETRYWETAKKNVPLRTEAGEDNKIVSRIADKNEKDAKRAVLFYEIVGSTTEGGQQKSLVKIKLGTGRHHQIRVQMANMGCPIWGDTKYGNIQMQEKSWRTIALCAYRLEIEHPRTKIKMQFEIEARGEGFQSIGPFER